MNSFEILGIETTNDLTYHYVDIPLLLRLSLGDTHGEGFGLYVNGGGYAGYAYNIAYARAMLQAALGQ